MILKNFVVFEGIDGSGTSTQLKLLQKSNSNFYITCEPTDSEIGKFLRRMLKKDFTVDEKTNAFLFAADRCEHLYGNNGIIQTINQGKIVISDRYLFSSLAYQSSFCEEDIPTFVNSKFPLPELLFYFKIDPKISLQRVSQRTQNKEIYEQIEFQEKIAQKYEQIISKYKNSTENQMKIIQLDATKSISEIHNIIINEINKLI